MKFRKLDLFPYSGEGMEARTLFGPIEKTNLNHLNHWTQQSRLSHHLNWRQKQIQFPKLCFLVN
jgi:hypothetical protein